MFWLAYFFQITFVIAREGEYAKCKVKLDLIAENGVCTHNITSNARCHKSPLCQQNFNITYLKVKAYSPHIVTDMLQTCCGPCDHNVEQLLDSNIGNHGRCYGEYRHRISGAGTPIYHRTSRISLYSCDQCSDCVLYYQ